MTARLRMKTKASEAAGQQLIHEAEAAYKPLPQSLHMDVAALKFCLFPARVFRYNAHGNE